MPAWAWACAFIWLGAGIVALALIWRKVPARNSKERIWLMIIEPVVMVLLIIVGPIRLVRMILERPVGNMACRFCKKQIPRNARVCRRCGRQVG
jgi:hypothetical protein